MKFNTKYLAFSCLHAPLHNEVHVEKIVKKNQDLKPDVVVCLGDLFEASAASKWTKENTATLAEEYEIGNGVLARIRKVNPNADYIFLEGNHDANILAKGRLPEDIRGMLDYKIPQYRGKDLLNPELVQYWKFQAPYLRHRTKGCFRLGAVCFAHGYEAGVSSDEMQAIYFNQLWANSLFISGHTHRPTEGQPKQAMKTKKRGLPYWYLNAGCSCDMGKMDYMDRADREQWGNGFVFGSCDLIKSPRLTKTWEAECVVTQWFEE